MTTATLPTVTCPAWCRADHDTHDDHPRARLHTGRTFAVPVGTPDVAVPPKLSDAFITTVQWDEPDVDEPQEPRCVQVQTPGGDTLWLTPKQARTMAACLLDDADTVEAGR